MVITDAVGQPCLDLKLKEERLVKGKNVGHKDTSKFHGFFLALSFYHLLLEETPRINLLLLRSYLCLEIYTPCTLEN